MENLCSSNQYVDRNAVLRYLWKSDRAIPVLPINLKLDALRVLNKQRDEFQDVGSVYSLCKPGKDKEWLKDELYPRHRLRHLLPPSSIGKQIFVIHDDDGEIAKALVGPANAAAWFRNAESIQICIPDCEIRELNMEHWDEMIQRFDPDLQTPTLGPPERNGKRDLFVVQRVFVVSHIKIIASYKPADAGLEAVSADPVTLSQGVNLDASSRTTSSGSVVREFTLSAADKNRKLPVAFSGFLYTYDKFGNRDVDGKETQSQADGGGETGESSGASSQEEGGSEEEQENAQTDDHMGTFLVDNEWFATVLPGLDPSQLEIMAPLVVERPVQEPLDAGERQEHPQEDVVDPNASGLEDID